jgi:hypothetical protein
VLLPAAWAPPDPDPGPLVVAAGPAAAWCSLLKALSPGTGHTQAGALSTRAAGGTAAEVLLQVHDAGVRVVEVGVVACCLEVPDVVGGGEEVQSLHMLAEAGGASHGLWPSWQEAHHRPPAPRPHDDVVVSLLGAQVQLVAAQLFHVFQLYL